MLKLSPPELVKLAESYEDLPSSAERFLTLPNRMIQLRDTPDVPLIDQSDNQAIDLVTALVNAFLPLLLQQLMGSKKRKPQP